MRIELGSRVHCSDGDAGELADVVLDPASLTVTHLVVRPRGETERLVPVQLLSGADRDGVAFRSSRADLAALPSPEAVEFLPVGEFPQGGETWDVGVEDELPIPSPTSIELGDFVGDYATQVEVAYDRVPKGTVELRRASLVESADHEIVGTVHALVLDGARITHVVLCTGHLWWRREHAVPIGAVARVETDLVATSLSSRDVRALPAPK